MESWLFTWGHEYLHRSWIFTWGHEYLHGVMNMYMWSWIFTWGHEYLHGVMNIYMGSWIFTWGHEYLHGVMNIYMGSCIFTWGHEYLHGVMYTWHGVIFTRINYYLIYMVMNIYKGSWNILLESWIYISFLCTSALRFVCCAHGTPLHQGWVSDPWGCCFSRGWFQYLWWWLVSSTIDYQWIPTHFYRYFFSQYSLQKKVYFNDLITLTLICYRFHIFLWVLFFSRQILLVYMLF